MPEENLAADEAGEIVADLARELARLRAEVAQTRRSLDAAREETAVLGRECQQLLDLLAQQDVLLGRASAPPPQPAFRQHIRQTARRLAARVRPKHASSTPPSPKPAAPPPKDGPLVPFSRASAPARPVLLAVVNGLTAVELERIAVSVHDAMDKAGVHVVFLTDSPALAVLRRRVPLVEYLPPQHELERLARPAEAELYLARRLEILCRKWQPVRIVPYGEAAAAWLARLCSLPEAAALGPLVGAVEEGHDTPARARA